MVYVIDYYDKYDFVMARTIVGSCFGKWKKYPKSIFKQLVKDMKSSPNTIVKLRKIKVTN